MRRAKPAGTRTPSLQVLLALAFMQIIEVPIVLVECCEGYFLAFHYLDCRFSWLLVECIRGDSVRESDFACVPTQ